MIRSLVDFALNNRFLIVLASRCCCWCWGGISFHNLPVEAYPDVANNYVQVITQWPGRAAEEVEQQVTIPLEIVMNGIPHLEHLRSVSIFGLSSLMLIFDDESPNDWNRQKVLERLSQVNLPAGLQPQIGSDYSPVGPDLLVHAEEHESRSIDLMELKSLQDWVLVKQFKSVPNVVDVVQLRRHHARVSGARRSEQAGLLRAEHRPGGAATREQQRERRRQLPRSRDCSRSTSAQWVWSTNVHDIESTVLKTQNGTPIRVARHCDGGARAAHPAGQDRQSDSSRRRQ